MDAETVVRRYWEQLWGGSDVGLVAEVFSEPYVRHNREGTSRLTHADLRDVLTRYWSAIGGSPRVTIDDLAVSGDRVWSRVTVRGNDAGTGEPMVITFLQQVRVADGRVAESWSLTAPDVDWTR